MRSPGVAILWELWRITRTEIAWKLALPIGIALTALAMGAAFGPHDNPPAYRDVNDNVAAFALIVIVLPHLSGWLSMARLNGGRPGFPLYLSYTRPVRTAVLVAVPMAYLTVMSSAIYLVSATVLRVTSGYAFPLFSVTGWIAALTIVFVAAAWSTRDMTLQMLASMLATVRALGLSMDRLTAVEIPHGYDWPPRLWPSLFDWPTSDYAWIALIGLASFGVTFAMVTRQRRGDAVLAFARTPRGPSRAEPKERFWYSLVDLFRFRCPTSSAARAQVWLDLKANGLPVLTLGVAFALVILVLSAVSGPVDAAWNADQLRTQSCANNDCFFVRVMPVMLTPLFLVTILSLGGNAFGIRRRQGRVSVSAFEATQAYGTAQLAIVKVLVKSVCVLTALIAIGISVWISLPLLGDAVFIKMWGVPLSSQRSAVNSAVTALTAAEQIALAIVAVVGVGLWVAWWSAVGALWTRYSRRLAIAASLLMLYALAVALLALASWRGIGPEIPLTMILRATLWVAAAAIVLATAYLVWSAFAEQLMTIRHGWGVVALSTAFAAAWLTVLQAAGLSLTDMTASGAVAFVSPALLPLTISVLAPWSYSRVRHT